MCIKLVLIKELYYDARPTKSQESLHCYIIWATVLKYTVNEYINSWSSPSSVTNSYLVMQVPNILWNMDVKYGVRKRQQKTPIWSLTYHNMLVKMRSCFLGFEVLTAVFWRFGSSEMWCVAGCVVSDVCKDKTAFRFMSKQSKRSHRLVVSLLSNPHAEGPPLVGCLQFFIQYIHSYPPHLEATCSISTEKIPYHDRSKQLCSIICLVF